MQYARALRICQAMSRAWGYRPHMLCKDTSGRLWEFISCPWVEEGPEPRILVNVRVPGDCTTMKTVEAVDMDPERARCSCQE